MILFDVTNSVRSTHHSGLQRVSSRVHAGLIKELGERLVDVVWSGEGWRHREDDASVTPGADDILFTPEVFGPDERPGFATWLAGTDARAIAVYYDAIPLKLPAVTWPKSVARHPSFMKQLASFDRVLAISEASRAELLGYWKWAGIQQCASVAVIPLGSDADGVPRTNVVPVFEPPRSLLMVGIVEPRKGQSLLLDVCDELWESGLEFDLHMVGRTNPHFGKPIVERAEALARRRAGMHFHGPLADAKVSHLRDTCRAAVFPTIAEGNGLPVIEALWRGIPCVCSRIPAIEENAAGGGCLLVDAGDRVSWRDAIRSILTDDELIGKLRGESVVRPLPTWEDTSRAVLRAFKR